MAFKNIFGSIYAVVENIHYNGPRRQLSFDLVQYTNSRKEVETGRMHYQVKGDLTTFEVESVITSVPSGIEHEAMPDDFDFDLFDSFKPYLIGNSPDAALADSDRVGYCYVCEHKPAKSEATGEWPNHSEEYTEEVDNPTMMKMKLYLKVIQRKLRKQRQEKSMTKSSMNGTQLIEALQIFILIRLVNIGKLLVSQDHIQLQKFPLLSYLLIGTHGLVQQVWMQKIRTYHLKFITG